MESVRLDFVRFESFSRSKSYQEYACFSIFNVKLCTLVHFVSVIVILDVIKQSSFSYQVHCSSHKSKYGKFLRKFKCNF